ncbi:hypothetical protein [Vibrio splendidus]|uniref:hypothetical protein n=1 Tax=Vibrio splendidus TaxID=29497 RepID=UPI000C83DF03|nr:hypothetical protein [Vibrio splendidus]PMO71089.1 hypothetical protein BCT03_20275 [Vibrio splendidus]
MYSDYEKYKYYKNKLGYFDGIDMGNVLAFDLGVLAYFKKSISNIIILADFFSYKSFDEDLDCDSLFTIGEYGFRHDYLEILDVISSKVESKYVHNFYKKRHWKLPSLSVLIKSFSVCNKLIADVDGIKYKLYILSKTVFYLSSLKALKLRDINVNKYIAFSSVHTLEALLTNYFRTLGISTYTMQHGVAHIHTGNIPIDMLSYENFNADYQLCWGEYSKEQYESYGVGKEKLLVAGYPKIHKKNIDIKINIASKNVLILLARKAFHKSNISLLDDIIGDSRYKVYLKPHPSLKRENYVNYLDDAVWLDNISVKNSIDLKDWSFSISINTSAYYESFLNGVVSFMYIDRYYEGHKIIPGTEFMNVSELTRKIETLNNKTREYSQDLSYILGSNIDQYRYYLTSVRS